MEGKNSAYTKQYNRRRLLGLLRQRPLSRAELARQMGLTRAAISLITEELIGEGILRESSQAPEDTGPGRTPTLLKLCAGAYYAVGVSLRRSGCRVGIQDLAGDLLVQKEVTLDPGKTWNHWLAQISGKIGSLLNSAGVNKDKVLGVGIAAPGPLDVAEGMILNPPDFPGWEGCPICRELSAVLDLPVYLENDANAAAMYNYMDCDFPQKENFLLLFVDCGVGSGVISQGRLLRSHGGFTCELGHTSIDFRGPVCSCGNRGCLEMYASIDRLLEQYPQYESWEALMASPDRDAALELEAEYLSAAVINFSNVVRIEGVLLGGRLQKQSGRLLPMIRRRVGERPLSGQAPVFMGALHNEESYVRSACSVVFCRFLQIG